jgi:hypothetical protein
MATRMGHIYRIQHVESDVCYIGSTFNVLKQRWFQHKSAFKAWTKGETCGASIYHHMAIHGLDKYKMMLVKSYEVIDRKHLEAYESLWIKKLRACNRSQPFALSKLQQSRSDYIKHREKRCATVRAYADKHKIVISERKKEYHLKNKESILARKRIPVTCECGAIIRTDSKLRHMKSASHKKRLEM